VKLVIVGYGVTNIHSMVRAVKSQGVQPIVTSSWRYLEDADAVIVPGVTTAAATMAKLREHGLIQPIREYIASGRPFLGVCMGQQALFDLSEEEGRHQCLGVLQGRVLALPDGLRVPHMGWNKVRIKRSHPIFAGIDDGSYFYFVHSYYPQPDDHDLVIGDTEYGIRFASAVARDNVVGTQFHPETSGDCGLKLIGNFLSMAGRVAA
jgi:glutamine amidotransferase